MKTITSIFLWLALGLTNANSAEFYAKNFENNYFNAWTVTQASTPTKQDIEHYLSLLADYISHQHLPYDSDDTRTAMAKKTCVRV